MSPQRSNYFHLQGSGSIPEGWDGLRVGSEFCSQLLPSANNTLHLLRKGDPKNLSLITPVARPDEIGDVMSAVMLAVSQGWGEIVVNDWGVLSELGTASGIGITAGRLLMRFRRGPGVYDPSDSQVDDPWDEQDLATRRYFAWGPLYDSPFLAFLRRKGVDRIELDLPRYWLPMPDQDEFHFSLHRDTRFISLSAACPWLYNPDKTTWDSIKGCGRICGAHSDIMMTTPTLKGPLFLRGRAILERTEVDIDGLHLPDSVDRIICDGSVKGV